VSQALYRRYRSQDFDSVIGQDHITSILKEAIKRDVVSHAYLFTGPRGVGKTSVARIFAHAINNLDYSTDTHLDIIEIDAASNRRIDDIRDLRDKIHIAPTSAKYKIYIIDEVHMLTGESFNALLKTLEEPPAHVIFILATTEMHKVPATIVSRTQRFTFKPGTKEAIAAHLKSVATKEKVAIDEEALSLIADHSDGSYRDSLSLLDQIISSSEGTIQKEFVEALLGVAPISTIEAIIKAINDGDSGRTITLLKSLFDMGVGTVVISLQLMNTVAHELEDHPELANLLSSLIDVQRSSAPQLKLLSAVTLACNSNNSDSTTQTLPHSKSKVMALTAEKSQTISKPMASRSIVDSKLAPSKDKNDTTDSIASAQTLADTKTNQSTDKTLHSQTFTWDAVLEVAKNRAPALYAVLKRAQATCNPTEITLGFQYALHRKKMNDSKYNQQLRTIIVNSFDCDPEIIVTDPANEPLSSDAAAVADIMGGGNTVHA